MRNEFQGDLHGKIRRVFHPSAESSISFDARREIAWGYETRRKGEDYEWDGQKRGVPPDQPRLLFQYTFRGRGEYAEGKEAWSLGPGDAFLVLLPSSHRYYLPLGSDQWTFFWFIVKHPYVTERIRELRRKEAAIQKWQTGSPALESAVALFCAASCGQLSEVWNLEERLFSWLLEMERELHHRRYPRNERDQWLNEIRHIVRERLQRAPSAADLAEIYQLERTTFSRKFKAATGLSPAAFVTEIRLEEALKLLRTHAKLQEIAFRTGFADANHFCKVFRRHFRSSPGVYRRLVGKR